MSRQIPHPRFGDVEGLLTGIEKVLVEKTIPKAGRSTLKDIWAFFAPKENVKAAGHEIEVAKLVVPFFLTATE